MSNIEIIKILKEYIPRKKSIAIEESHSIRNSYLCANPEGSISNADCPDDDPLCNCPAKELIPSQKLVVISTYDLLAYPITEEQEEIVQNYINEGKLFSVVEFSENGIPSMPESAFETKKEGLDYIREQPIVYDEPTDDELDTLLEKTKECAKIEEVLGEDWLGCDWEDPNSFLSCNCPNVGDAFLEYLEYNDTIATFWNTEDYVPLYSVAQRALLNSQKIMISVAGDISIRPGDVVLLEIDGINVGGEDESKRTFTLIPNKKNSKFNGRWLVQSIKHKIAGVKLHKMELLLIRDSLPALEETEEAEQEA